jgi:hypothetical protein
MNQLGAGMLNRPLLKAGFRYLTAVLPLLLLVDQLPATQSATDRPSFDGLVKPFLAKHCTKCHNRELLAGGMDLDPHLRADSLGRDRDRWERIFAKLRSGEMPPREMPRPDPALSEDVTRWIAAEFDRLDALAGPDPGRVTARRLNRAEYNNSVRDLLGLDLRLADEFPQDDSGYGFDNIGDVLSLSPALMERYLAAAEKLARSAVFGPAPRTPRPPRNSPPPPRKWAVRPRSSPI